MNDKKNNVHNVNNIYSGNKLHSGFIKTGAPVLSSEEKVLLNRKANTLFNNGDIETAKKIYITTNYSAGLERVGDFYMTKKRLIEALPMYTLAHAEAKKNLIIERIAALLRATMAIE